MVSCLWCDQEIVVEISWITIWSTPVPSTICEFCAHRLYKLTGQRCMVCSRESQKDRCQDCSWWAVYYQTGDVLKAQHSIFLYNDFMKAIIAKWKYRGDYVLGHMFAPVFAGAFNQVFSQIKDQALIVPVPLSDERQAERAFNQAEMLARFLTNQPALIVERIQGEKQSKKSRRERILSENVFNVTEPINKPVILVDDIYTTGTTLRHIAQVLRAEGCPDVYAITLARG